MSHWPSNLPFRLGRLHRRVSARAVRFAQEHPRLKAPILEQLRIHSAHPLPEELGDAAASADLCITPLAIVYADLYFIDDFDDLRRGIRRLQRSHGESGPRDREVLDWLRSAEVQGYGSGTTRAGRLRLDDKRGRRLFSHVDLSLAHVTPSVITMTVFAHPSKTFIERWSELVHAPTPQDLRITSIPWRGRFVGVARYPASKSRTEEIEHLLLLANKEVVALLRQYLHCGLAQEGPLATVQAFTVNRPRSWLDAITEHPTRPEPSGFLDAITHGRHQPLYTTPDYVLYRTANSTGRYAHANYRLLTTEPTPEDKEGYYPSKQDVTTFYDTWGLGALIGLEHAYTRAVHAVLSLRHRLAPDIRRPTMLPFLTGTLRYARRLTGLQFRLHLLARELQSVQEHLAGTLDVKHITRGEYLGAPAATLYADVWGRIRYEQDLLNEQLEILTTAHQDVVASRSLSVGYSLQWIAIGLAAATLFTSELHDFLLRRLADIQRLWQLLMSG